MRVKEAPAVEALKPIKAPESRRQAAQADRVSITQDDDVTDMLQRVRAAAATERSRHTDELTTAVREGTYSPSPEQLAQKILDAAILDAQLSAMIKR